MMYKAHTYKVTDEAITPTGKVELYPAETREQAVSNCLYTHRLHNGNAYATKNGVIHCSCGQIAVVKVPEV